MSAVGDARKRQQEQHHTHHEPAVRDLIAQAEQRGAEQVAQAVERAFTGDEFEENAAAAAGEGEWSWFRWLAVSSARDLPSEHRDERPSMLRVHNHPPYRPECNERRVDGHLRGACLNDDGSDR